jgi:uncharacterized membrane protein YfcA
LVVANASAAYFDTTRVRLDILTIRDYRLGIILGVTMFLGALIGARLAAQLGNLWLRRIFLTAVWVLGLKTLVYDLMVKNTASCHAAPTRS